MKTSLLAALSAAVIGTFAASAAHAKTIDFGVAALGGSPGIGYTGATLDQSSAFDLDGALLIVSSVGAGDSSGLVVFNILNPPGTPDTVNIAPSNIAYGSANGNNLNLPLGADVTKSWKANGDSFTEKLDTVLSINRGTQNAITVILKGKLNDTLGDFVDAPAFLIVSANQAGGPHTSISLALTNTSTLSGVPEPSTWVMMALGFGALGYAATRKGKAKIAMISA
jgi:opacity protein-like surface antigen